jgi:phosphoserine aminotransferase
MNRIKKMERKINFNAGPATLPASVLEQVAAATLSYEGTGMSILELPHRSKAFDSIIEESKQLARELCGIDSSYEVVWLHGGGRQQFCMVPANFLPQGGTAAYIDSGYWAHEAMEYAQYYGSPHIVATSAPEQYTCLPQWPEAIPDNAAYLHLTTNNTIYGTQWHHIPPTTAPLIADMSSDILSRKHDYSRYALFYAAAQKNLGTPGVALAVIHKDLLKSANATLPPLLSYAAQVQQNSIVNTANVSGIYTSLLMLRWIKNRGIDVIEAENKNKAELLYSVLDNSTLFTARVRETTHRSLMNVCFTATSKQHEAALLALCSENNITGLEGHRHTGGFRVSLYNAMPLHHVALLAELMQAYERST